jgi:hypothetical protein
MHALGASYVTSAHSWYSQLHGMSLALGEACMLKGTSVLEASRSKFGGLPVFDENAMYDPIPERLFSWPQKAGYQVLSGLGESIKAYESFGPPHVSQKTNASLKLTLKGHKWLLWLNQG